MKYNPTAINNKKKIIKNAAKPPPPLLGFYGSDIVPSGFFIAISSAFFFKALYVSF